MRGERRVRINRTFPRTSPAAPPRAHRYPVRDRVADQVVHPAAGRSYSRGAMPMLYMMNASTSAAVSSCLVKLLAPWPDFVSMRISTGLSWLASADDRARLDAWQMTARVLRSLHEVLPDRAVKIVPTQYPMCSEAWELEIDDEGKWTEVLAWGVFTDRIVRHLGADPRRHTAIGVGYGLERIAMLRYGIDDIRKVDVVRVA